MKSLTSKQYRFLHALMTFERKKWFVCTHTITCDDKTELELITRCIQDKKYTNEDKVYLNDIADYFRKHSERKIENEDYEPNKIKYKNHFKEFIK